MVNSPDLLMIKSKSSKNLIKHEIGLVEVKKHLLKQGYICQIDRSISKSGHISIRIGKKDIYVMVKVLTKSAAVPFSSNFKITNNFSYLIIYTDIHNKGVSYYKLDMQYVKKVIKSNKGSNGRINYWLSRAKYEPFKVTSLVFP